MCVYIDIYIKKSHLRRTCKRWWTTLLHRHPPSRPSSPSPTLSPSSPSLLRFARTFYILPIPFSTYNLHASIVQTDDGNYLRFSANAINQKRRSASPPGPLERQGYPPSPSPLLFRRFYLPRSSFGFRLDSTPSIDNSRLILLARADFSHAAWRLLPRVHDEFRGSR